MTSFKLTASDGEEVTISADVARYLATLDEDGVERIRDAIETVQLIKTGSKVVKWVLVAIVSTIAALLTIWSNFKAVMNGGAH